MRLRASPSGSCSQTAKWAIALGKIPDQAGSLKDADRDALVRAIARHISRTIFDQGSDSSLLPPALGFTDCVAVAGGRLYSCVIENRIHFKFYPRQHCADDEHDPDFTPPHKPSPRNASADEFVQLVVTRLRALVCSQQLETQSAEKLVTRHSDMRVDVLINPENEAQIRLIEGRMPNDDRNNNPMEFLNLPLMCTAGTGNALVKARLKSNITNPLLKAAMENICQDEERSNELTPELLLPYLVQTTRNRVLLERWS